MDKSELEPVAWMYECRTDPGNLYRRQIAPVRWPEQKFWTETPLYAHPPSTETEPQRISAEDKDCGIVVEGLGSDEKLVEAVKDAIAGTQSFVLLNDCDLELKRAAVCEYARAAIPIIRAQCEAEIVAWLREHERSLGHVEGGAVWDAADAIERGEYRQRGDG